jgi:hypothetical protein
MQESGISASGKGFFASLARCCCFSLLLLLKTSFLQCKYGLTTMLMCSDIFTAVQDKTHVANTFPEVHTSTIRKASLAGVGKPDRCSSIQLVSDNGHWYFKASVLQVTLTWILECYIASEFSPAGPGSNPTAERIAACT